MRVAVLAQAAVLAAAGQVFRSLRRAPLIVLTHVLYGFGFWRGLFTHAAGRRDSVRPGSRSVLETIPR